MGRLCPRRGCGTVLDFVTDGVGRVVALCMPCERNRAGWCRDCPIGRLHDPRALRCPPCAQTHRRRQKKAQHVRDWAHPETRARRLAYFAIRRQEPAVKEYQQRYKREHAVPRDDFDRRYHREWARRWRSSKKGKKALRDRWKAICAKRKADPAFDLEYRRTLKEQREARANRRAS
jgi:hypothetical protein